MFFLDKDAAAASSLGPSTAHDLHVWRYMSPSKYTLTAAGDATALGAAFDIKREPDGTPKEPSASLFQLKNFDDCCRENALKFLNDLVRYKNFDIKKSTASGALMIRDVEEIRKDPKAFSLLVSTKQKTPALIHWDLAYSTDDRDEAMQDVKNALAVACKVFVKGDDVPTLLLSST